MNKIHALRASLPHKRFVHRFRVHPVRLIRYQKIFVLVHRIERRHFLLRARQIITDSVPRFQQGSASARRHAFSVDFYLARFQQTVEKKRSLRIVRIREVFQIIFFRYYPFFHRFVKPFFLLRIKQTAIPAVAAEAVRRHKITVAAPREKIKYTK